MESQWKSLCADQQWKYREDSSKLQLGECLGWFADDPWGEREEFKAVPLPATIHRGAGAPAWVWETKPSPIAAETNKTYLELLMCVVTGRFVCVMEDPEAVAGIPQTAERYRWRYWDNNGNVYQQIAIKWSTRCKSNSRHSILDGLADCRHVLPGDFDSGRPLWFFDEDHGTFREFWDAVWMWRYEGSTTDRACDEALRELARQAGVPASLHRQ